MENFVFYSPTKIFFGKEEENKIGEILKNDGIKKVLFVYGRESIKKIGLYDKVINSLKAYKIEFVEHSGVKPNPVLSHTLEGVKKAKEAKVDAILGVGGGSVIDESKAIALGVIVGEEKLWDCFEGKREIQQALPVYDILTVAATGTEMNGNAVITHDETKEKLYVSSPILCPKVSILNPELTFTISLEYQAYAAVDVIAHLIELYFSAEYSPKIQSRLIEALILTVMDTTEKILENPKDYQARAEFMWASTLALNGLMQIGFKDGAFHNHMFAHAIGGLYDLPHGACLSIVIPAWMSWYKSKNLNQFQRFAEKIFKKPFPEDGIKELKNWFKRISAPVSFKDAGLDKKAVEEIAKMVAQIAHRWNLNKIYDFNTAKEVLTLCLE
ncbi:MAG: NADH-dependent alcohol dehydrogenase [Thermodesulfobacterium geofontis]|uniref:NADH-dependent alcohol dehydrogenase n=1 Tax=Thermodesulfobacterium geofontis TaxID=1295609 RepID=A0A2N7Q613_9BACT|nr:MAG: NADH-dependent alcohol dehydrogenase [Thermodesulfobacterium geofontis]